MVSRDAEQKHKPTYTCIVLQSRLHILITAEFHVAVILVLTVGVDRDLCLGDL